MKFIVIGITDHPQPFFPPEVLGIIKSGQVFSGGRRHHEIVEPLLPDGAEWIDITVPLDKVFEQYQTVNRQTIVVFASGDPLFFGFANTIRRKMPEAELVVYPSFNSLQMLAHRLLMPYHDMRIVSLTGRPWPEFDRALIERVGKIGVLTDREHTPQTIARRMLEYGYDGYVMHVGEHLGNPNKERVTTLSLDEAAASDFDHPNCVILSLDFKYSKESRRKGEQHSVLQNTPRLLASLDKNNLNRARAFGIPDSDFALLDGREKMITKMPIRLLTLQALDLPRRHVLWDIGFCTGSVSIEARLQFPHLHVVAFEIRPECEAIIAENARRHGAPGIEVHIGDFLQTDCEAIPAPDAIFIGGHGGELKAIMTKALRYLAPDGIIVMNSVKAPKVQTDSHALWDEACHSLGLIQEPPLHIQIDNHHPITILKCKRQPSSK